MADESRVEIGYLEKSEAYKLESRYFPSKVGGRPAWLNLKDISIDVSCQVCNNPCIFLCQIYAPGVEKDAHHRTIYVFVCRNPECNIVGKQENFKVYRCQLPLENNFYPQEEPNNDREWHPECTVEKFNPICAVCGCLSSFRCGSCRTVRYCSKEHQVLDWKSGHNKKCGNSDETITCQDILFPEYEILTEPEMDEIDLTENSEGSEEEKIKEYLELVEGGKGGALQDVPLELMDQLSLALEDKYLKKFKAKLSLCPDQVIRYERGGQPLWVAKPTLTSEDIPNCEFCQGPREFEFQILSTLLSYLNVDSIDKSIDWGSLLVYTCKNHCSEGPAYKKEFLWKQDIL